uniref:Kinesin motor domain-containing protein n=1 Tax=Chromera velia CCMP2878 TaxID=1169474 RepID=A0A0G4HCE9_9ALVE|eukprot:Cvel_6335.t1-p1 / transcript=Cvel_6335.t1 / gene=Cvel_6335 / organism=Chromera_velia_CCMP2878 / gene_product=Kinesin-related protein 3, putative / transcript_product=Kinesin-related protein 3, putative / location=Cvel_scaffold307:74158-79384(-) / protein_length=541 / sequence_SO=supercontig / SO=protein_coding / is_pseudo=false
MASKPAAGSAFKHARRIYGSSAKDVPGGTVGKSRLLKESEKLRKSASSGPSPPNLLNETGDFGTKEKDLKGKENEKEKEKVLSRSLLNHLPSMSTGDGDPSWRDTPEEDASTFCCTSEKTNGNDRDSQGRSLTVGSEISVGQSPLQAERSGESGEGAASGNNSLQPPSLFVGMARASESAPPLCELPGTRKGCSVVVRIRPESEVEARAGGDLSTRPSAGQSASAQRGGEGAGVSVVLPESDYDFHFDGVFNMNTTQGEFYSETMGGIPRALLEGYNAAVITYGQTGAGKTFSMLGPMEEMQPGGVVGGAGGAGQKRSVAPSSSSGSVSALGALRDPVSRGAAPRLLEEVFTLIRRRETDVRFEVRASFIEIYNERVQDLLTPSRDNLKIRENRETGKVRAEATEVPVSSCADALSVLETGVANRVQAHTKSNACSSRLSWKKFAQLPDWSEGEIDVHGELEPVQISFDFHRQVWSHRSSLGGNRGGCKVVSDPPSGLGQLRLSQFLNAVTSPVILNWNWKKSFEGSEVNETDWFVVPWMF